MSERGGGGRSKKETNGTARNQVSRETGNLLPEGFKWNDRLARCPSIAAEKYDTEKMKLYSYVLRGKVCTSAAERYDLIGY